MKNLNETEEQFSQIETEGSYKIKEGSYYHVKTDNWDSGGMEDDYFKDFVFPHSVIYTLVCNTNISLIFLLSGVLLVETDNLMRVQ